MEITPEELGYAEAEIIDGIALPKAVVHARRGDGLGMQRYRQIFGFGLPNHAVLDRIVDMKEQWLDLGCGTGYWTQLLREKGAQVTGVRKGTDDGYDFFLNWSGYWFMDGEEAVRKYDDHNVLMVWPCFYPSGESWALRAARALKPGRTLVFCADYATQWGNSCCACSGFHRYVWNPANFDHAESIPLPRWWGMDDHAHIFRKKK
jgi:SAM-dependent methyltransferase